MSKAKMQAAKELIESKQYDEARALLKTVDDAAARDWLAKLDRIAPHRARASTTWVAYVAGGIVGLIVGVIIGLLVPRSSAPAAVAVLPTNIATYTPITAVPATSSPVPTWTEAVAPAVSGCVPEAWWSEADRLVIRFLDTAETASQTARASLSGVILEMRQAQRDFEALDYPDCIVEVRRYLSSGMNLAVDGFNSFLGQSEIVSSVQLEIATQYFWDADNLLRSGGIVGDFRMSDTAVFIWGGSSPNAATATALRTLPTETAIPASSTPTTTRAAFTGSSG